MLIFFVHCLHSYQICFGGVHQYVSSCKIFLLWRKGHGQQIFLGKERNGELKTALLKVESMSMPERRASE